MSDALAEDDEDLGWTETAIAPVPLLALLAGLGGGAWFAMRRLYVWDPPSRAAAEEKSLHGIRGWLVLPALYVVLLPLAIYLTISDVAAYMEHGKWRWLPDGVHEEASRIAQPVVWLLLAIDAALLAPVIALAVLFFRKRTALPIAYIAVTWAAFAATTATTWSLWGLGLNDLAVGLYAWSLAGDLVLGILWTLYILKSKRVRDTFIRRLSTTDTATVVSPGVAELARIG